ncbi:hypothetical protein F4861DRAFT_286155 [Xylaria intraflava]|nr:hypothetical protein F4861DRAFT_286155 [Xylaria intraflava]
MALPEAASQKIATAVGFLGASTLVVMLRFLCKYDLKAGFHADDAFILLTQVDWYIYVGLIVWDSVAGGKGKDASELGAALETAPTPDIAHALQVSLKVTWSIALLSFVAYYTIKMAILIFCRRIFSTDPYLKLSTILIVVNTVWFFAIALTDVLHCLPIQSFWNKNIHGHCLNFNVMNLVAGVIDIVLDVLIWILPIVAVSRTQMPLKTRILVSGIFVVGSFAIITNILRLKYTYQASATSVALSNGILWLDIHIFVATTCACLPVYKPLWARGARVWITIKTQYSSSVRIIKGTVGDSRFRQESHDGTRTGYASVRDESTKNDFIGLSKYPSQHSDRNYLNSPSYGYNTTDIRRDGTIDGQTGAQENQIQVTRHYEVV